MKNFLKRNWQLLTGLSITGAVFIYARKGKKLFGYSGINGVSSNKIVQFTLTNNTSSSQTFSLFNAWGNGTDNPNVGIMPSPQQFNQQLMNQPVRVTSFEIRGPGASMQANMPIQKMCSDSNGTSATESYIPMMSAFQPQGGIITVQPANLILDGGCFLTYTMNPNTTVIFMMRYDQLEPSFAKNYPHPLNHKQRTQIQDKVKGLMEVGV